MTSLTKKTASLTSACALLLSAPGGSAWAALATVRVTRAVAVTPGGVAGAMAPLTGAAPSLSLSVPAGLPSLSLPSLSRTPAVSVLAAPAAAVPTAAAAVAAPTAAQAMVSAVAQAHPSLIREAGALAAQPSQPGASSKAGLQELGRVSANNKGGGIAAAFGAFFDGWRAKNGATPVRAGGNAADQAADMLKGDNKAELLLPGFYWGGLELGALAKAPVNLRPEAQSFLDA